MYAIIESSSYETTYSFKGWGTLLNLVEISIILLNSANSSLEQIETLKKKQKKKKMTFQSFLGRG